MGPIRNNINLTIRWLALCRLIGDVSRWCIKHNHSSILRGNRNNNSILTRIRTFSCYRLLLIFNNNHIYILSWPNMAALTRHSKVVYRLLPGLEDHTKHT